MKKLLVNPAFIIAGAMKSGTTSIHHLLGNHPDIFIPEGEVQLFTIDDIQQNPVFFQPVHGEWTYQDFEQYFEEYACWHQSLYQDARKNQLLGEDSPTYLPSKQAIDRITKFIPDVKLLILLRDPIDRLESHYWHWVRTYRAIYPLEDTIRFQHGNLLQRSYYEEQLRYCLKKIPRSQVHVTIFEEFVQDQNAALREIFRFLNISDCADISNNLDESEMTHRNQGRYPKFFSIALLRNRLMRELYGRKYLSEFPRMSPAAKLPLSKRLFIKIHDFLNPLISYPPVSMKSETKIFLKKFLWSKNKTLPEFIESDLSQYWFTFQK